MEKIKEKTQQHRVYKILKEAQGEYVDGMIFERLEDETTGRIKPITQYHARIHELQKMGYNIVTRRIKNKTWNEYALIDGPILNRELPPAFNIHPKEVEPIDTKQSELNL